MVDLNALRSQVLSSTLKDMGCILRKDINYYRQGFMTATAGRSHDGMEALIVGYNMFGENQGTLHDYLQIRHALWWANKGYDYYKRTGPELLKATP